MSEGYPAPDCKASFGSSVLDEQLENLRKTVDSLPPDHAVVTIIAQQAEDSKWLADQGTEPGDA